MMIFDSNSTGFMKDLANRLVLALERKAENSDAAVGEAASPGSNYVPMTVETFDNHIYFYARVDTDRCLDLIKRIRETDNELRRQAQSRSLPDEFPPIPIWLHIQSNGGELFTGLNIADQIASIKSPVYSIVEGVAASAATLITMACDKRFILPSSFMLIHQLSSNFWGTYEELADEKRIQDMLMERLYDFYVSKSNLTKTKVKTMLKRDSWFSASECIDLGLVDCMVGADQ